MMQYKSIGNVKEDVCPVCPDCSGEVSGSVGSMPAATTVVTDAMSSESGMHTEAETLRKAMEAAKAEAAQLHESAAAATAAATAEAESLRAKVVAAQTEVAQLRSASAETAPTKSSNQTNQWSGFILGMVTGAVLMTVVSFCCGSFSINGALSKRSSSDDVEAGEETAPVE